MGVNNEGPHRVPSLKKVTPIFGHWEQDAQEREEGGGRSLHRTAVLESGLLPHLSLTSCKSWNILTSEPQFSHLQFGDNHSTEDTVHFSSVQSLSRVWFFATPWTAAHQPSCPSPTPRACPNSCPLSRWCHPTISSSVIPFSSCLQSFPASGSFPMSPFFTSGGQSFGVSASASVLPMNIQDWFPLGLTSWISLQSKELSRVFSNTKVQKHQFFSTQLFL